MSPKNSLLESILVVLFMLQKITSDEANYVLMSLKGRQIPPTLADIAYLVDEKVGEYRMKQPQTKTNKFFDFFRKLNK